METVRKTRVGIMLALATLVNGCLSRPVLVSQSFTFSIPRDTNGVTPTGRNSAQAPEAATGSNYVLAIKRITVAAPFAGQSFVYRTSEFSYEQDPYAQFLVSPEEGLAEPLRAWFRNSGIFRAVTEAGSARKALIAAEVTMQELYGDFRDRARPAAVLTVRMTFLDARSGAVLVERNFSRRVPLKARTAAALMAGWNEALEQIVSEASENFKDRGGNQKIK